MGTDQKLARARFLSTESMCALSIFSTVTVDKKPERLEPTLSEFVVRKKKRT